jgi:hypothetical protein
MLGVAWTGRSLHEGGDKDGDGPGGGGGDGHPVTTGVLAALPCTVGRYASDFVENGWLDNFLVLPC